MSLVLPLGLALSWAVGCASPPVVVAGHLPPCPTSNNCVSSEADPADGQHYVAPLAPPVGYTMPNDALARVRTLIVAMPRSTIVGGGVMDLRATFESRIFGFTDDVVVRSDFKLRVLQVRSASRHGYGDMGVNRARVEELRRAWDASFSPKAPAADAGGEGTE